MRIQVIGKQLVVHRDYDNGNILKNGQVMSGGDVPLFVGDRLHVLGDPVTYEVGIDEKGRLVLMDIGATAGSEDHSIEIAVPVPESAKKNVVRGYLTYQIEDPAGPTDAQGWFSWVGPVSDELAIDVGAPNRKRTVSFTPDKKDIDEKLLSVFGTLPKDTWVPVYRTSDRMPIGELRMTVTGIVTIHVFVRNGENTELEMKK